MSSNTPRYRSAAQRSFSLVLALAISLLVVTPVLAAVINWVSTERVSVSSAGVQGNNDSGSIDYLDVSEDGRYVIFESTANNLAAPDADGTRDVFLRDLELDTTELISVNLAGTDSGDGASGSPSISSDGRYVAFDSSSTDLVATDGNGTRDCFVRDLVAGTTELVSWNTAGTDSANGSTRECRISGNGRYVLFASTATDLVATDSNGNDLDLFLRDLVNDTTEIVSLDENDDQSGGIEGTYQDVSYDGRFIMFASDATVVSPKTYSGNEVYVRDRVAGTTERMSVDSNGNLYDDSLDDSVMSSDGRYFAWNSDQAFVSPDTNGSLEDVFVHDRITGETIVVSVDSSGNQGNDDSYRASLSNSGRYIAFISEASDLVSGDTNGERDVFVHDTQTGETTRVSLTYDGSQSADNSISISNIVISGDGSLVAIATDADDLVLLDTNGDTDVFAIELDLPLDVVEEEVEAAPASRNPSASKEIAETGTTTLVMGDILVSVPASSISGQTNCRIEIEDVGNSGDYGFKLDDSVWDVNIVCDSGVQHIFFAPITVCIRPDDGVVNDKQVFHRHDDASSFTGLANTYDVTGYVCGQTRVLSLFTLGDFSLPATGFAPDVQAELGAEAAYANTGLQLSIPELGLTTDIVGVPQGPNGWDVSWLGDSAGYLVGTAFPTLAGNTVITAHVWGADNQPGPFYELESLGYGDRFSIEAWGSTYTYEVRLNTLFGPSSLSPLGHADYDWVTLVTCQGFDEASGQYIYRRVVRAVLVSVD